MIYPVRVLLGLNQFACTLLGGWPDEALSSYVWRLEARGKLAGRLFRPIIDSLFFWEDRHCYHAMLSERRRYQVPPELR